MGYVNWIKHFWNSVKLLPVYSIAKDKKYLLPQYYLKWVGIAMCVCFIMVL